jgi:hypothetical protein
MKNIYRFLTSLFIVLIGAGSLAAQDPRAINVADMAVIIDVKYNKSKPSITINWQKKELAYQYEIRRKLPTDANWGFSLAKPDANTTSYTDDKIEVGKTYEYQVYALSKGKIKMQFTGQDGKTFDSLVVRDFIASGYTYAGIEVPQAQTQGKVLLVVDETIKNPLATEIKTFQDDLKAEGWAVITKTVPRAETFDGAKVKSTKQVIKDEYDKDQQNLKAVILLGRVPVPYSGRIYPDGHPDHEGAWPADVYYACTATPEWTDASINVTVASRQENKNIPGDGKFDLSQITSGDAKLQVGRVDFYNMPAFKNDTEIELLRKYLNKNHQFRKGLTKYQFKSLIDDNFTTYTLELFGTSGWRNFGNLLGASNVKTDDFFITLDTASYMWAYGCGGGTYTSAGGIGNTDNFANAKQVKVVFTMLFGSYFGDWDAQNAFMRAALASQPSILTCAWAARPHWYFHHMGLGLNIGYSAMASQNNYNLYIPNLYYLNPLQPTSSTVYTSGNLGVHTALMGDPTLGMYLGVVPPPTNLSVAQPTDQPVQLTWTAPNDNNVIGYNIYRSSSPDGSYRLLNNTLITSTNYDDKALIDGMLYYIVRAVKLQVTNSGSFFNESPGISGEINAINNVAPAAPLLISPSNGAPNQLTNLTLKWENSGVNIDYELQVSKSADFSADFAVQESKLTSPEFSAKNLEQKTKYYWRVKATNLKGSSPWSEVWNFSTKEKLAAPTIAMPSNGAKGVNLPVITNWFRVSGATSYNLQLCRGDAIDEGNLLVDEKNITDDYFYIPEEKTLEGTMYAWRMQAVAGTETSDWGATYTFTTSGINSVGEEFDKENRLLASHFPEPVTNIAFINFNLSKPENIKIELYNNLGMLIQVIAEGSFVGGQHQVRLLRENLPSGAYFYKIKAGNLYTVQKLIME